MSEKQGSLVPAVGRPFAIIMAAIGLLCVAILLYRALVREESLKEAAERCLAAAESGDARTLLRYVTQHEIVALNLDEPKLSSFVNHFFVSSLEGFSPKGEPRFEPHESYGDLDILRDYEHPDGRTVTVVLSLTPSEDGPKLAHATEDIFFSALRTYWPAGKRPPLERGAILNEIATERAMPKIAALPLTGFAGSDQHDRGVFQLVTWDEWQERVKSQAERIRAERR